MYISCGTVAGFPLLWSPSDHCTVRPDPLHGSVGTPAVCANMDDAILSPRAHIAFSGGPNTEKIEKLSMLPLADKIEIYRYHFDSFDNA